MESKANYTLVGVIVLILIATLLSGGLWLSVGFDQKKYDTFMVYMSEPVSGLNEESPVKYNGVRVGYISDIELNPLDPQRVELLIKIETGTPITMSTKATLIAQGITGTTYLGLTASSSSLIPLQKTENEPYPVIPYQPSFLYQLETNITTTLEYLKKITITIADNNENIDKAFSEFPALIKAIKMSTEQFNTMANDVSVAGKQFTKTMKAGKNSLDQISQQTLPPAVSLLKRLDAIAANLEVMSAEMRQNPAIIVRGTTPPKRGPGE